MYRFYRDHDCSLPVAMLGFSELLILIARSCGLKQMYDPMRFLLSVSLFMFFIMAGYELKPLKNVHNSISSLIRDTVSILLPFIIVSLFIISGIVFTSRKIDLLRILFAFYIIRAVYAAANAALLYFGFRHRTYIVWLIMLFLGIIGVVSGNILMSFLPALAGLLFRYLIENYTFGRGLKLLAFIFSAALFIINIISGTFPDSAAPLRLILSIVSAFFLLKISGYVLKLSVLRDISITFARHPVVVFCIMRMDTYIRQTWTQDNIVSSAILRIIADLALILTVVLTINKFRSAQNSSAESALCDKYRKPAAIYFYVVFAFLMVRATLSQTMILRSLPGDLVTYCIHNPAVWLSHTLILVFALSLASVGSRIQLIIELSIFAAAHIWYNETNLLSVYTLLMLVLSATGKDFRKMMKIYFFSVLSVLAVAWWTSLHGYVTNLIFYRDRVNNLFPRYALGTNYVTDLASHWFYLITIVCILKPRRKRWTSFIIYPILLYVTCYIYHLTNARLNMFATLTVILITLISHIRIFWRTGRVYRRASSVIGYIFSFSYLFCLILSFYMVNNYNIETMEMPFQSTLGKVVELGNLQQRLRIAKTALNEYPLTIFGNAYRYNEIGEGGAFHQTQTITFLDISYIKIPFMSGILIAVILLFIWTSASLLQAKQHNLFFVLVLAVVALTGLIEHHLAEYYYNLFSLALFSAGFIKENDP